MNTLLMWLLPVSLLIIVALVRTVRLDGYGVRRPPASHEPWRAGNLPSYPYSRVVG